MSTSQNEKRGLYNARLRRYTDEKETQIKKLFSRDSHKSETSCMSQETATDRLSSENDSDMCETKRKRLYSRQSHESETSCMSQETATTRLSSENDSDIPEGKRSNGRNVSFCLVNEIGETVQDSKCDNNDIAIENNSSSRGQPINRPYNFPNNNIYESLNNASERNCYEEIRRQNVYPMVNNSRNYSQNSFSEGHCRHPLLRRPSTYSAGTINEHSNDSELGSGYADVHGHFSDSLHQCVCTFDHSQCQKMCSSVKVLKRIVFALCVFNILLLILLIIVPAIAVIYFQASKDSSPDTIQPQSSSEQKRTEPSCVKCQSLMQKLSNFIKTQKVIENMADEDGRCCLSDPEKLMTILNQLSEEAVERSQDSGCRSCPSGAIPGEIKPAVHLKSRRNGLVNVSMAFSTKFIESTHFVGWHKPIGDDHQGLWGHLHRNGTLVKVNSHGMYFIYVMIQHNAGNIKSSSSDNMTTATSGMHHAPLKVTLYKCKDGTDGETHIYPISQMYYSTDNRAQQNTYFGRIVHLTANENVYLGISGYGFIHQESESHYMGLYKI